MWCKINLTHFCVNKARKPPIRENHAREMALRNSSSTAILIKSHWARLFPRNIIYRNAFHSELTFLEIINTRNCVNELCLNFRESTIPSKYDSDNVMTWRFVEPYFVGNSEDVLFQVNIFRDVSIPILYSSDVIRFRDCTVPTLYVSECISFREGTFGRV